MTDEKYREKILGNMKHLLNAREFLLANNKSLEAQREINKNPMMDVESPLIGGTEAKWIRLVYDDVWLYLHDDGTEEYQLDPFWEGGAEIIAGASSYEEFVRELNSLTNFDELYKGEAK